MALRRFHWWDGSLWWYTYTPGGYEGYRTAGGRRLPCAALATALKRPDMRDEIRKLAGCSLCEAWKAQRKAAR